MYNDNLDTNVTDIIAQYFSNKVDISIICSIVINNNQFYSPDDRADAGGSVHWVLRVVTSRKGPVGLVDLQVRVRVSESE